MTRWLRFLLTLLSAKSRKPLKIGETSQFSVILWPTECDASYLNHSSLLALFECGRIDIMIRYGFLSLARTNGWYLPLMTISARYYRPVRRFDKIEIQSKIIYWDDTAFWIEHRALQREKVVATALVKNGVRKGREAIVPAQILEKLGQSTSPPTNQSPTYQEYI